MNESGGGSTPSSQMFISNVQSSENLSLVVDEMPGMAHMDQGFVRKDSERWINSGD